VEAESQEAPGQGSLVGVGAVPWGNQVVVGGRVCWENQEVVAAFLACLEGNQAVAAAAGAWEVAKV
jgi:hypothetical protein